MTAKKITAQATTHKSSAEKQKEEKQTSPQNDRIDYDAQLTPEVDRAAKDFMNRSLLLLKVLYLDDDLRKWCQEDEVNVNAHPQLLKLLTDLYYRDESRQVLLHLFDRQECCNILSEDAVKDLEGLRPVDAASMSKTQILAAVSVQFLAAARWAHVDEYCWPFLKYFVGHGTLIPFFEAYLAA